MITVTKTYRAEIAHRLMNYTGKCAHLHGHSYRFEVTVRSAEPDGALNQRLAEGDGMLLDFKFVKRAIEKVIEPYDHSLVLYRDDPLVSEVYGGSPGIRFSADNQEARLHVWAVNPTAENMAHIFARNINNLLPTHFKVTHLRVWETATSHADWRER